MKNYKGLNLRKVLYISEFYHVPDSLRYLLKVFNFMFNGVKRENLTNMNAFRFSRSMVERTYYFIYLVFR